VLEVTPKGKESSKHSFNLNLTKDKTVVLEPKFKNNSDPIDQLRALALLKEANAKPETNELQLMKFIESDGDDHEDIWRENDDNFYKFTSKKPSPARRSPQNKIQSPNQSKEFSFVLPAETPQSLMALKSNDDKPNSI
jgi:hypothetical protein